ncbi:hypothetical protein JW877_02375, partial [bacterium]|nr:hypothetical protein [bacterium]
SAQSFHTAASNVNPEQYYITITFDGAGTLVPIQTGEGWYDEDFIATITTERFIGSGADGYVFSNWESDPPGAFFGDVNAESTTVIVDTSYTLNAHYVEGVRLIIEKNPAQSMGMIYYDGMIVSNTSVETLWCTSGSFIDIAVSERDSCADSVFGFICWGDSVSDTLRNVGPIDNDTTFTAYYSTLYLCTVRKQPMQAYGFLYVDTETYTGIASILQRFWWQKGSIHDIGVSNLDEESDSIRYVFKNWNDGGSINHETTPISRPITFTANYTEQYLCQIIKEPLQAYGSIFFDDSTFMGVGEYLFWGIEDSSYYIGISELDVSDDSIYSFLYWSDGGGIFHYTTPIGSPSVFTAYYSRLSFNLRICLDTVEWHIDTLDPGLVRSMLPGDRIQIQNCGDINIDLGLHISESGVYWGPQYIPDTNYYALRGHITSTSTVPLAYHPSHDNVKNYLIWADSEYFGPEGDNVSPGVNRFLWLQFLAPTVSTIYNDEQIIILTLTARVHIP